jgi:hypothetical protein
VGPYLGRWACLGRVGGGAGIGFSDTALYLLDLSIDEVEKLCYLMINYQFFCSVR